MKNHFYQYINNDWYGLYMHYSVVLAVSSDGRGIGINGTIPWKCRADLLNFKDLTTSPENPILIMGRRTYESMKDLLNKPGEKRKPVVLTRNPTTLPEVTTAPSLKCALENCRGTVFVVGGASLYDECFSSGDSFDLYLTVMKGDYECDTYLKERVLITGKPYFSCEEFDYYRPESKIKFTGLEKDYLDTLHDLLKNGEKRITRNGPVLSLFSRTFRFDVREYLPLMTTKSVSWKNVFHELIWFLRGETDTKYLTDRGVKVWDQNARTDESGNKTIGPMYGFQLRNFGNSGHDQIGRLIESIKKDPYSRRHLLTTYNPVDADSGVLYPCHGIVTQFYVSGNGVLNMYTCQRSADWFLGACWNLVSYTLLLHMIAKTCGLIPGELVYQFNDVHLYADHISSAWTQLMREPGTPAKIQISGYHDDPKDYTIDDIIITEYSPRSFIFAKMIA